jgi:hypothetical protein
MGNIIRKFIILTNIQLGNLEVTPQRAWTIAKSLNERDEPKALTEIRGHSGFKFYQLENIIANTYCFENHSTVVATGL